MGNRWIALAVLSLTLGDIGCSTLPLRIESARSQPVFLAEGSPPDAFAMEETRVALELRDIKIHSLPIDKMRQLPVKIEIQDFQTNDRAGKQVSMSSPFPFDRRIVISHMGHFTSGGEKSIVVHMGPYTLSTTINVLNNPGCLASAPESDIYKRGWVIGGVACLHSESCTTITRSQDMCNGGRLLKFECLPQYQSVVKTYQTVSCPQGCYQGACLKPGEKDPRSNLFSLKLLSPKGDEMFRPGQEIPVSWESKGILSVSVSLYSETIHQQGGAHTLGIAILADDRSALPSRKSGEIRLPPNLAPADDWVLTIAQSGVMDALMDQSSTFTVRGNALNAQDGFASKDLKASARKGDSQAAFQLAEGYAKAGEFHKALYWYQRSGDKGNAASFPRMTAIARQTNNESTVFSSLLDVWNYHHNPAAFQEMFTLCNSIGVKEFCQFPDSQLAEWFALWWPDAIEGESFWWSGKSWIKVHGKWHHQPAQS